MVVPIVIVVVVAAALGAVCILIKGESVDFNVQSLKSAHTHIYTHMYVCMSVCVCICV